MENNINIKLKADRLSEIVEDVKMSADNWKEDPESIQKLLLRTILLAKDLSDEIAGGESDEVPFM